MNVNILSESIQFTFNFTLFEQCANVTRYEYTLWTDSNGEYVITPNNQTVNYDLDTWLDCVDDQDLGDIVSICDGTYYTIDFKQVDLTNIDNHITWTGNRYTAGPNNNNLEKNCCDGMYDVFRLKTVLVKMCSILVHIDQVIFNS